MYLLDKGTSDFIQVNGLPILLKIVHEEHTIILDSKVTEDDFSTSLRILESLTTILEVIGENGVHIKLLFIPLPFFFVLILNSLDTIQRSMVSQNLLNILLDFVDHLPTAQPTTPAPEAEDEEEEEARPEPKYADIRKRVSRIVTLVTMNGVIILLNSWNIYFQYVDANMYDIPKHSDVILRFKRWMTLGLREGANATDEDELRMSGALSLGNLARSGE
jgi:hypothetical protein